MKQPNIHLEDLNKLYNYVREEPKTNKNSLLTLSWGCSGA